MFSLTVIWGSSILYRFSVHLDPTLKKKKRKLALNCILQFMKQHELCNKLYHAIQEIHDIMKPSSTSSMIGQRICSVIGIFCILMYKLLLS